MVMDTSPLDTTPFDLRGTHYDIGVKLGQASALFTIPPWWPEPPSLEFAEACAREIAAFDAPLLDEVHGYADGQSQSYKQILRILCRQRLAGRIPAGRAVPVAPEQGGCTSLAWRSPDGRILIGRNYDFHEVQRIRQRIRLHPAEGFPTVGMRGSVPGGRYDGVNEAGLFVCLHIVLSEWVDEPRAGIPFHLIPRILLEKCRTMDEAVNKILAMPHLHSFNYLIADPDGFCCVECHHDRIRIVHPEDDLLATGNFYRHPEMTPLQKNRQQIVSRHRVAYLESGAWQHHEPDRAIRAAMEDHSNRVCGHEGGHTTLWSCVADLTERKIYYTAGSPCREPYLNIPWPE